MLQKFFEESVGYINPRHIEYIYPVKKARADRPKAEKKDEARETVRTFYVFTIRFVSGATQLSREFATEEEAKDAFVDIAMTTNGFTL